jgi:hypothetical protein
MWIFAKHGFLSIVQHRDRPDMLMVRARVRGDIARHFPDAKIIRTNDADYLFRTILPKRCVAVRLFDMVREIDYDKVKPAFEDKCRSGYYFDIWAITDQMQEELNPR